MDLELKEFEEKINNITEQFMSLLDSNDVIEGSVEDKFDTATNSFEETSNSGSTTFYDTTTSGATAINDTITTGNTTCNTNYGNYNGTQGFKLGTDDINIGGIAYANGIVTDTVPNHAVKFDSVEQMDLNQKLESLYKDKKNSKDVVFEKPSIAFSDSNLKKVNGFNCYGTYSEYTKDQTDSTIKNKEVYEMANYCEGEKTENVLYDFATVPAEKALVEKKSWKEVLFSDIPWDTKIDIWGGIKKLCSAQVRITFD